MTCKGRNLDEHCCWVKGKPCEFLEENVEQGFRWSCMLRRTLGSWDAVLKDPRYQKLKTHFEKKGYNCKTYPTRICGLCGAGAN